MFSNPYSYVRNKKKPNERELLLYANPLYGDKLIQKGSFGSCLYHSLNYIRCRYKQKSYQYPNERHIEKIFSDTQRTLTDLVLIEDMLANLFEGWVKKDGFLKEKAIPTQEWIDYFTKKSIGIIEKYNFLRLTKKKNDYLYNETCRHLHAFVDVLKSENLPKNLLFIQIRAYLGNYFKKQDVLIQQKVLTKDLKLNLNALIIDFLKRKNQSPDSNFDVTKPLSMQGLDIFIPAIYIEQVARFNNLHFFSKDILKDVNTLLDAVEKNGALVFVASGNVVHHQRQVFVRERLDFSIYDLEFNDDDSIEYFKHAMILVGGEVDSQFREFVYVIDPNNYYTEQAKTPIYRLTFDRFKSILQPFEQLPEKVSSLNRYFFMYGEHGLNRTRDPVLSKKTEDTRKKRLHLEIDDFPIKKLKTNL